MRLTDLLTRQILLPTLIAGAVSAGAAGFAGWTIRGWRCDAALLKEQTARVAAQNQLNEHVLGESLSYEQGRAQGLQDAGVRENTLREIYRDVKVSADCEPPAAAVSVLNRAVDAANARVAGEPAPVVSAAPGAAKPVR